MSGSDGQVFELKGNQRLAADPKDNVWLSASAGTGKTQVLSARVLRLLLRPDVDPSEILCLTFTKAGAAEMANRINAVLARWVRLDAASLATELGFLGADIGPEAQARARTLFASVLDCPGGGLRIDTIHAFAQYLLANFPGEAGLIPGAKPMEDREQELLAREVLSDMLAQAEAEYDRSVLDAVEAFVRAKSPDDLRRWLIQCGQNSSMWQGTSAWTPPMSGRIHAMLGIPANASDEWVAEALGPDVFPDHQLAAMLPVLKDWNAKGGREGSAVIEQWLALPIEDRLAAKQAFYGTLLTKQGAPKSMPTPEKVDPEFKARQSEVADALALVEERAALLDLANFLTPALELGRAFALRWEQAKIREGLLDFDDLIVRAAGLLANSDAADWIRYKLDRRFDHILIDEAQDTNQSQWDIVFALVDDFFTGEGAAGDKLRTLFTVGDYKQAIFGFQGTSPDNFASARELVRQRIENARQGAIDLRRRGPIPNFEDLELDQSFRTSKTVLDFVNRAIETIGHGAFGLDRPPEPHQGATRPGLVTMWNPVQGHEAGSGDDDQDWLADHDRELASRIAEQVWRWHSGREPFMLAKQQPARQAAAGDIMVLVRKRGALAALIVAKLHAKGVPVAGVDRLRLGAPLAVQDLLAGLRFAAQPLDDLTLANLLASPLLGWTQDDLLEFVPRERGVHLWDHLRKSDHPGVQESVGALRALLALADFETPQALLAWMLVGPWQGRRKLVERLGSEANDAIDELLNSAFAFESGNTPSLAGFIQWFDASDDELKRDSGETVGQVRVMTVHGSKGLQAPLVVLADATGSPRTGAASELDELAAGEATGRKVPLPRLSKEQSVGPVKEAAERASIADMQEHWRLLYVAMTRAEEGLFIGGSLSASQSKRGVPEDSWYARLAPVFEDEAIEDDIWGARKEWGYRAEQGQRQPAATQPDRADLPNWAATPVGPEPRPPMPFTPSAATEDLSPNPPLESSGDQSALQRGVLIHQLLERLPDVDPAERSELAKAWLKRQAPDIAGNVRDEMIANAIGVLSDARLAEIFSPNALAETPLTALVGNQVIAGKVDRLLVEEKRVTVVDYKTSRRPPRSEEDIPVGVMRQMAAYALALERIYPNREIRVAVLYTQGPSLFELTDHLLKPHKLHLLGKQESYSPADIE